VRLNLYASYWVDNRSGLDLLFQDHAAARQRPLLLGARLPFAFAPVLVPGACGLCFCCLFLLPRKKKSA
jgi:hypothetical protein